MVDVAHDLDTVVWPVLTGEKYDLILLEMEDVDDEFLGLDFRVEGEILAVIPGTRYLIMVLALGGGLGGGGGGVWLTLLPADILGKCGFGFIVIFFITHVFTPALNVSSFGSVLRLTPNLLKILAPL